MFTDRSIVSIGFKFYIESWFLFGGGDLDDIKGQ